MVKYTKKLGSVRLNTPMLNGTAVVHGLSPALPSLLAKEHHNRLEMATIAASTPITQTEELVPSSAHERGGGKNTATPDIKN